MLRLEQQNLKMLETLSRHLFRSDQKDNFEDIQKNGTKELKLYNFQWNNITFRFYIFNNENTKFDMPTNGPRQAKF